MITRVITLINIVFKVINNTANDNEAALIPVKVYARNFRR